MGFEFEEKGIDEGGEQKKKDDFFQGPDVAKFAELKDKLGDVTADEDEQQRVINNCACWGDFG